MNDIKVKRSSNKVKAVSRALKKPSKSNSVDLSFIMKEDEAKQKIQKPSSGSRALFSVVSILVLALGVFLGTRLSSCSKQLTDNGEGQEMVVAEIVDKQEEAELFVPDVYYLVELQDDSRLYAKMTSVDYNHYRMSGVFYMASSTEDSLLEDEEGQAATSSEDEPTDFITLTQYTTETGEVANEILFPRNQVYSLTPLTERSPVVKAIREFLAENG